VRERLRALEFVRELVERLRILNVEIKQLEQEITTLVEQLAPSLVAICGCGPLTAAKILGETAGITRFRSDDAYARHNGTAPLPRLVIKPRSSPAQPTRQPATQRRAPPDRAHASALPPRRPRHDRAPAGKRRRWPRSDQSPQATTLRRRLPSTAHRPTRARNYSNLIEELRTLPDVPAQGIVDQTRP